MLNNPFRYCKIQDNKIIYYKLKEFKEYLKTLYKNEYFNFLDKWINDINRKTFEKIVFEPNLAIHDIRNYNLFNGFKYDNIENTDYDGRVESNNFFKVLKTLIMDEYEYNYLINWIAHIIQKPYEKTKRCIIMYADNNSNLLNTIINILIKIFDNFVNFIDINNIYTYILPLSIIVYI